MKAVIENTIDIARAPDEVFDYLVDMRHELEWNPDVVAMEKVTDGPIGVGTRYRAKWKQSGLLDVECTRYERPRTWTYVNGGPVAVELTITVEPRHGGTRLTSHGEWRPNGWFRLIFPVFVVIMRRAERGVMVNVRRALESHSDPAPAPE